ncbi:phosphotransferase [Nocardia sp. BSTN01]|uniref:phosphotransferase n=1 Tax=Nocardia sp. BSTN01 TaxID=2783665 RepID=UPI002814D9FE|nr:phosphotransferase [Nocardia sp. BSTN01]
MATSFKNDSEVIGAKWAAFSRKSGQEVVNSAEAASGQDLLAGRGIHNRSTALREEGEAETERAADSEIKRSSQRVSRRPQKTLSEDEACTLLHRSMSTHENALRSNHSELRVVETSLGRGVVRVDSENDKRTETFLRKQMPLKDAMQMADDCGLEGAKILYAGTDPVSGREFMISGWVPGEARPLRDPNFMTWFPDIVDQMELLAKRGRLPPELQGSVAEWQRANISYADRAFRNMPAHMRANAEELGLGPPSQYMKADVTRTDPAVPSHNDIHFANAISRSPTKSTVIDWEFAGAGDLVHGIRAATNRQLGIPPEVRAAADRMAHKRLTSFVPANPESSLQHYRQMEHWRALALVCNPRDPQPIGNAVERLHPMMRLWHEPGNGWPLVSKEEFGEMLARWRA